MPAANIMAIQLTVENSGFSSSPPRRMCPNFDRATPKMKKMKTVPASTNSQPVFSTTQPSAVDAKFAKLSGHARPHTTMARMRPAAGMVTAKSMPEPAGPSESSPGRSWSAMVGGGTTAPEATPAASPSPEASRFPSFSFVGPCSDACSRSEVVMQSP